MKQVKTQLLTALSFWLCLCMACGSDDAPEPVTISIPAINLSLDENPAQGQLLGTASATASRGSIAFSLTDQNPAGAMSIDGTSGNITVANPALFDFETNPTITAKVVATAEGQSESANLTITLSDVDESTLEAQDFSVTIDENPDQGQSLGTIVATSTGGPAPSFSISSQTPAEAMSLNSSTGELTVNQPSLFDFETNPSLTANIEVTSGNNTRNITATITLNDVDEVLPNAFTTTWQTTMADEEITIPINDDFSGYNYTVAWGDGNTDSNQTGSATHRYTTPGTYTVQITGDFPAIQLGVSGGSDNADKIMSIEQWGNIAWQSMEQAFQGAENMVYNATDAPDLSAVTSMAGMFSSAKKFDGDLNSWDVSQVQNMNSLFAFAEVFNGNISDWDMANVTNVGAMFQGAGLFNQPIGNWDVGNVINFNGMFISAQSFNQPLNDWDVSSATAMPAMFSSATSFNQDLNDWDVSNVINMNRMFFSAGTFNGNITGWDVSKVRDMFRMFAAAIAFNQDIGNWNVAEVTNFGGMFINAFVFDQNLSAWNVSKAVDMSEMFRGARVFNQPLNDWNTENVTNMKQTFDGATAFNQPLNQWNVAKVQNMEAMFRGATVFNQSIHDWDISQVNNMTSMMDDSNLSTPRYDLILQRWSNLMVQSNVTFGARGLEYSNAGESARQKLIDDFNWSFVGDTKN